MRLSSEPLERADRFNRRNATSRGLLFFYRLLQQAVHTDPHPLDDLLAPNSNPYLT